MVITDKEVLKELKTAKCPDLWENLKTFPEAEQDGQSEMQILANECCYLIEMYNEDGTRLCEDLKEAREFIKETKNGKSFALDTYDLKRSLERGKMRFQQAKNTVNEYNRLTSLKKRLEAKGYYGR